MSARPGFYRRRFADWIIDHPRGIALVRLICFTFGIMLLAVVGAARSAALTPVYYDAAQRCDYNAVEAEAPLAADRVPINQPFVIMWRFANTGNCETWQGVKLVRLNDAVPGPVNSYSIGSPVDDPTLPPELAGLGSVQATVALTAPIPAGIYVTEWQLQSADNRSFGPVMARQIQIFDPALPLPTQFVPNPPPPGLFGVLRQILSPFFYALPAVLAIAFVLWRGVAFMNALYGLKHPASSQRHVMSMMFGLMPSYLSVTDGKIDREPSNMAAEVIGGPAWLLLSDYSAAVLERGSGFSRVVGPGYTFLLPHERVRGAIDLHTQHRTVREKVMTKDGIPVEVDVDLVFRITDRVLPGDVPPDLSHSSVTPLVRQRLGRRVDPTVRDASREHPFSHEAVRRAVYESTVFSPDRAPDWAASFANVRAGDISDQLVEMRLDEILAPDSADHPLREVPAKGLADARKAGESMGIDVIDMTMGTVDLLKEHKDLVGGQMLANWRAEWSRRATVLVAQGQAKRLQLTEEARAEAQANMIQALTEGFRIATGENATKDLSREVIALRFIDTLEALMQNQSSDSKDKSPGINLSMS